MIRIPRILASRRHRLVLTIATTATLWSCDRGQPDPKETPSTARSVRTARSEVVGSAAVERVARRDMAALLATIPRGEEADFGLPGRGALALLRPGRALAMTIPATLSDGRSSTRDSGMRPLGVWRVPLLLDGVPRLLLTVAHHRGGLRAVEIGAAGLAAELAPLLADLPRDGAVGILRLFDLRCDLLWRRDNEGMRRFWPLSSARSALNLAPNPLGSAELWTAIRAASPRSNSVR